MGRKVVLAALFAGLTLVLSSPALAAPSTGPTNLRVTDQSGRSVSLAWDAAKIKSSTNWWYCVQSSGAGCFRVDPPKTTFTHPSLWPGSTYTFTVVTVDKNGNRSAPSNAVTVTIPPDTTPPTAPVLSVTSVLPIRVSVSWTASTDETQVFYTLLVDGAPYNGGFFTGVFSQTVLHLEPGSTHTFQVRVSDWFGNTSTSNVETVTLPAANDAVPPGAPSNLRFSSETSIPELWLDWDAASDNADPPGALMYEVFINATLVSSGIGNDEDIVYCAFTGLNAITVRAVDTSGNAGPFSNEISIVC